MNPVPFILLAISLPLLLGSVCNADIRTWTAVNGKEVEAEFVSNEKGIVKLKLKSGKVFEVPANKLSKEDNEFISSLAKPEGVNRKELELRGDIWHLKGSDTPYTGTSIWYENGQKVSGASYKDGKQKGLFVAWHSNGQKKMEGNIKDGKPDGLWMEWYENGQKKREDNMKDGKPDGLVFGWYEDGQKKVEGNYKDGKHDGLLVTWHENGQKWAESNSKDGKKISEKLWNSKGEPVDSEEEVKKNVNRDQLENSEGIQYLSGFDTPYTGKAFALYENGQKSFEENFNKGRSNGLQVMWHENGQKSFEVIFISGEAVEGSYKYWNEDGERVLVDP